MAAGKPENLKMLEPGKPPPRKRSRKGPNKGKSIGHLRSTETMEHRIWKEFPEDLFETVVARLPIATFFRFRSVCRKWNSMLDSQSFPKKCAEVPRRHPWFYTIARENVNVGSMYDPELKKWHRHFIPPSPNKPLLLPVASAGGLVCFLEIRYMRFHVCNPLTRSFRELPSSPLKVWSNVAFGMTLNEGSQDGYKMMWVRCDGEYEVYNSQDNSWSRGSIPRDNFNIPPALCFGSQTISISESIYFIRSDPDGIVSYDTITGLWKYFPIPAPPHVTDHTLAECNGRVLLVGLLTKNAATCVCIWELQKMTLLWKEVDRMPNIWCLDFYGKQVRMSCLGNKGSLLLSLRSRHMNRLVMYDFPASKWVKVSGSVKRRGRKRPWFAGGTAFYPSLTDSA